MTKNTKTLLTIAGVGVVGYIIYNQFIKKGSKNFANFTRGRRTTLSGCTGDNCTPMQCPCGDCCDGGKCSVATYDENGRVSYNIRTCTGASSTQVGGFVRK